MNNTMATNSMSEVEIQEHNNVDDGGTLVRDTDDDGAISGIGSHCVVLQKKLPLVSQFYELKQNSDLNHPPPNWLMQASEAGQYFQRLLFSQFDIPPERPPSSVLLASHYPEKVGHVDVIADAKDIKKLLVLPYSHGDVSMVIHKAGNTLLIDELKPSTMLLKNPLFGKLLKEGKIPHVMPRKKDPALSRHRNMFSKLLYYSLQDDKATGSILPLKGSDTALQELPPPHTDEDTTPRDKGDTPSSHELNEGNTHLPVPVRTPLIVPMTESPQHELTQEDKPKEDVPSSDAVISSFGTSLVPMSTTGQPAGHSYTYYENQDKNENETEEEDSENEHSDSSFPSLLAEPEPQPFHLNVEWSIRDIRMLLGSDLPIFGRSGHPAISLKLRDMEKPITVLTGLDYWLDNLMCNVPELIMCFHINGIVQKYEMVKTEDLPRNLQFSPHEIQEVAQNILSFLKTNCTKEGHTYWLFRPKDSDVVKLYDLTSLEATQTTNNTSGASDSSTVGGNNPYAASVALLFYRVAQRMLNYGERQEQEKASAKDLGIVKLLLENCIKLLKDDRNSDIVISSYYLLAKLILSHVPSKATSKPDEFPSMDDEHWIDQGGVVEGGVRVFDEDGVDRTFEVMSKRKRSDSCVKMATVNDSPSLVVSDLRESSLYGEATPSAPPITPLIIESKLDRARLTLEYVTKGISVMSSCQDGGMEKWKINAILRLVHLAAQTYWILAEAANELNKLGRSLRYLRLCLLCYKAAGTSVTPSDNGECVYNAWLLAGDIHCHMISAGEKSSSHYEDFQFHNPEDQHVYSVASSMYSFTVEEDRALTLHKETVATLKQSIECYEHCQRLISNGIVPGIDKHDKHSLKMRLGNAWNELGRYYKHVSSTMDFSKDSDQIEQVWKESEQCFKAGLKYFDSIQSVSNQALLNANLGGLMKMGADTYLLLHEQDELVERELSIKEEEYCKRAIQYYTRGQEVLKRAKTDRSIWYSIELDLAAVHQMIAQKLQERPPHSRNDIPEIERMILSHLLKAIHHSESSYANVPTHNNQRHTHLSLFIGNCHQRLASLYQKMATSTSSSQKKMKLSQAEKHYIKSLQYYKVSEHQPQIIRTYLEKAFIYEQEAVGVKQQSQFKLLCQSLECLLTIRNVLKTIDKGCSNSSDQQSPDESPGTDPIGQLLPVLVQRLQAVLKQLSISSKKGTPSQVCSKKMYSLSLKVSLSHRTSANSAKLTELLDEIYKIFVSLS